MFAVVVIGPPGSGKTAVLTALHDLLADDHVSHAVVEVEAVAWASPPVADEQSFRHLAAIRSLYAEAGYPLILCGATVTSAQYMSELLRAVAADDRLVVVPRKVVHPGLPGGWWLSMPPAPEEDPDEASR